ncbi:MAG: fibronectin type III domain-containing protein [Chlorobi bacterium OLB7]|nr:MAG: fibronectin type III domain-containing protein [Chlorobi bacterium OLB7]
MPRAANLRATLFDLLGHQVRTVAEGTYPAGNHNIAFDCSGLAAGTYHCWITANGVQLIRRVVVGE